MGLTPNSGSTSIPRATIPDVAHDLCAHLCAHSFDLCFICFGHLLTNGNTLGRDSLKNKYRTVESENVLEKQLHENVHNGTCNSVPKLRMVMH